MSKSKRKLVVILSRVPYPLEKGDKLRAFYQIKELSKHYEIYLSALDSHHANLGEASLKLAEFCAQIHYFKLSWAHKFVGLIQSLFKGNPFQVGLFYNYFTNKKMHRWIARVNPDAIYVQLHRMGPYASKINLPKVLDFQDAFSMGVFRQIPNVPNIIRPIYRWEYQLLKRYEQRLLKQYAFTTIISDVDKNWIDPESKHAIQLILNGVDFEFYQFRDFNKEIDVLFTGNMRYLPNIDAAQFLVQHIMPLVWAKQPNINVVLAGSNPHSNVIALKSDHVKVTGFVDDLRPYYYRSKVFVAPMRMGSGLQNKLLEAMAMGVPCITSNVANNSLKATDNQNIMIANNASQFADKIIELLENKPLSHSISNNAFAFVSQFNWNVQTEKLHLLIEESIEKQKHKS